MAATTGLPLVPSVACASCGTPTDPLRAPRVACYAAGFRYFCSADCRAAYTPEADKTPLAIKRPRLAPAASAASVSAASTSIGADTPPTKTEVTAQVVATVNAPSTSLIGKISESPSPNELVVALVFGVLPTTLLLLGAGRLVSLAQAACVGLGFCFLARRQFMRRAHLGYDGSYLVGTGVLALSALIGCVARVAEATELAALAGLVVASSAIALMATEREAESLAARVSQIRRSLSLPGRRILPSIGSDNVTPETELIPADELRPGEELLLDNGDAVPTDAVVVAGEATMRPWLDADATSLAAVGSPLVAGSRVLHGRLRAVITRTGQERAWLRCLSEDGLRRQFGAAVASRRLVRHVSIGAAMVCALSVALSGADWLRIASVGALAHYLFANAGVAFAGTGAALSAVLSGLKRGIVFRSAADLDQAGHVSTAVFCARGTLLLGEPEVASVDAWGSADQDRVLSIAAGVQSASAEPIGIAVLRAARTRGIRPDGARNITNVPGLGMTAMSETGRAIVFGSRGLMLRERLGVAAAEKRLTELEASGRTVLLVAHDQRLIGLVALQDGLKPGARAAVQYLLDAGIEPVLLSGDSRQTCEALGRAVDIDHIRPEVLPVDRPVEIRRLRASGATVAVIGSSPLDDLPLGAAAIAVAMRSAGSSGAEWSVELASDDVREATFALRLAQTCRRSARARLLVAILPGAAALILCLLGVTVMTGVVLLIATIGGILRHAASKNGAAGSSA